MTAVLADVGAQQILSMLTASNITLKLFTNNRTPAVGDTASLYTEATGGGYASKTLTGGSWTIGADAQGNPQATYSQQNFVFTGPLTTNTTIYGCLLQLGAVLIQAETFATARTPAVNGDTEQITPVIKLRNRNSFV